MTPDRVLTLVRTALATPSHAATLADLAVLLLATSGDVTREEVRGALERSLVALLDLREGYWRAGR